MLDRAAGGERGPLTAQRSDGSPGESSTGIRGTTANHESVPPKPQKPGHAFLYGFTAVTSAVLLLLVVLDLKYHGGALVIFPLGYAALLALIVRWTLRSSQHRFDLAVTRWEHVRDSASSKDVWIKRCTALECYGVRLLDSHEYDVVLSGSSLRVLDRTTGDQTPALDLPTSTIEMFAVSNTRVRPPFKIIGGGFGLAGAATGIVGAAVANAAIDGVTRSLVQQTTVTVEGGSSGIALAYGDESPTELFNRIGPVAERLLPPNTVAGPGEHVLGSE